MLTGDKQPMGYQQQQPMQAGPKGNGGGKGCLGGCLAALCFCCVLDEVCPFFASVKCGFHDTKEEEEYVTFNADTSHFRLASAVPIASSAPRDAVNRIASTLHNNKSAMTRTG